eukprot:1503426-Amphidinium_carterae.1
MYHRSSAARGSRHQLTHKPVREVRKGHHTRGAPSAMPLNLFGILWSVLCSSWLRKFAHYVVRRERLQDFVWKLIINTYLTNHMNVVPRTNHGADISRTM